MIVALCLTTEKKNARPIELIEKVSAVCYLMTSKKDLKKCHLIEKRLFPSVERRIKTRKLTGDNPQYKIEMSQTQNQSKYYYSPRFRHFNIYRRDPDGDTKVDDAATQEEAKRKDNERKINISF